MHDQANDLRRLVRDCATQPAPASRPRFALAVISGGKGGVGTTTVAVNLAVEMAHGGFRTTLVDADPNGGDVAAWCGLEERYTLADVLAGRRTVREVLQPGPGGIDVLPGVWGSQRLSDSPESAAQRLLEGLYGLGAKTDLIVLDAGNTPNHMMRRFWQAADLNLVVTTGETPAILDTYAAIKVLCGDEKVRPIHVLVNQADSAAAADDVHHRLAQACRRFLGIELFHAGRLPHDRSILAAGRAAQPLAIASPDCDARRHIDRLATTLGGLLAAAKTQATLPETPPYDQNREPRPLRMAASVP